MHAFAVSWVSIMLALATYFELRILSMLESSLTVSAPEGPPCPRVWLQFPQLSGVEILKVWLIGPSMLRFDVHGSSRSQIGPEVWVNSQGAQNGATDVGHRYCSFTSFAEGPAWHCFSQITRPVPTSCRLRKGIRCKD